MFELADVAKELAAMLPISMKERVALDPSKTMGMLDEAAESFYGHQTPHLRLSYGKRCWREKHYQHNEPEKVVRPDGLAAFKMALGKFTELLLAKCLEDYLAKIKGNWRLDPAWRERTVTLRGIKGHTDHAIFIDGKPFAIIDFKTTKVWSVKNWGPEDAPDPLWGYPLQAANYLAAAREEGLHFKGFIWLVIGLKENGIGECAGRYMSAEDARPWEREAQRCFDHVRGGGEIPERIVPYADGLPCASKTGIPYCDFLEHCRADPRHGITIAYEV